jgi:hypothetical protein
VNRLFAFEKSSVPPEHSAMPTDNSASPSTSAVAATLQDATTTSTPNAVNAPATGLTPHVPNGFVPPNPRDYQGHRPSAREVAAATTAVLDLLNLEDYAAIFGATAPDADTVTTALRAAVDWRAVREEATAWAAYVTAQDVMAWKQALVLVEQMKPAFLSAVARNRALAARCPGLAQLVDAPKVVAKMALVTKARKKAASAAATEGPSPAEAAPTPATPTPVTPEPTPAPAVDGRKTVTINV